MTIRRTAIPALDTAPVLARRQLLTAALGLPAALALPAQALPPAPALPASGSARHPRDVGRKFYADGRPMRFEGNTFAGHVAQQGAGYDTFDRWLDLIRELPQHGFSRKLSLVPSSSWHVTLLGGVNDVDRRTPLWPADLPRDMAMAEVHRVLLQRLVARRTPKLGPCSFLVDISTPSPLVREGTLGIPLRPADEATRLRLREARDELAELIQLRRHDHDRYAFHLTLGYLVQFLDESEQEDCRAALTGWRQGLASHGPLLIPSFHFCILRDMFAFREVMPV